MNAMISFRILFYITAGVFWLTSFALAQPSVLEIIESIQPSIVGIKADNVGLFDSPNKTAIALDKSTGRLLVQRNAVMGSYQRNGAGVVVHESGVIVTNAHTVHKAQAIKVIINNSLEVPADIIKFVSDLDLALLKITPPIPLKAVPIADSDKIKLGDEIVTVGSSALLKQTVSGGRVKGLGTTGTDSQTALIQTTLNVYQGDSGGPLFDKNGWLIGLMTAGEGAADHSSFAIPSNNIKRYLDEYLNTPGESGP